MIEELFEKSAFVSLGLVPSDRPSAFLLKNHGRDGLVCAKPDVLVDGTELDRLCCPRGRVCLVIVCESAVICRKIVHSTCEMEDIALQSSLLRKEFLMASRASICVWR